MSRIALDTNVLIYCHSLTCEDKMLIAIDFFNKTPVVSSQVISEYLNVMRNKFGMEKNAIMQLCSSWLKQCDVQPVVQSTVKLAQDLISKYGFQIFDGLIVAAALEANCDILYSEDMQHGQIVEDTLEIVNPFV